MKIYLFILLCLFISCVWAQAPEEVSITVQKIVPYLKERSVAIRMKVGQKEGFGSGAIIAPNGIILTCAHVTEISPSASVIMSDGTEFPAKHLGANSVNDYSLLKIDGENLPYFPLGNSQELELLQWVIAVGHPGGPYPDRQPSIATGRIRALHKRLPIELGKKFYDDAIQTDVPIFAGNSGGPLVNLKGELVGVNGAIMLVNDLAFAVPIDEIKQDIPVLQKGKNVAGRNVGIWELIQVMTEMQEDIRPEDMQKLFDNTPLGNLLKTLGSDIGSIPVVVPDVGLEFEYKQKSVRVSEVRMNTVGCLSGIQVGDEIISINGKKIATVGDTETYFANANIGQEFVVILKRNKEKKTVRISMDRHAYSRDAFLRKYFKNDTVETTTARIFGGNKNIGFGAVISADGFILTCERILPDTGKVAVNIADHPGRYPAVILGRNEILDIALLKISPKVPLTFLKWDTKEIPKIGEWVISGADSTGCLQAGMISAAEREVPAQRRVPAFGLFGMLGTPNKGPIRAYVQVIQHDSDIEKNQFGTPVIGTNGLLLGINVGHLYRGTTLATPITLIAPILENLKAGDVVLATAEYLPYEPKLTPSGRFLDYFFNPDKENKENLEDIFRDMIEPSSKQSFLGVQIEDNRRGVKVIQILEGFSADKAGIQVHDIIVDINGKKITDSAQLVGIISQISPGTTIQIKILRPKGKNYIEMELAATLDERPEE